MNAVAMLPATGDVSGVFQSVGFRLSDATRIIKKNSLQKNVYPQETTISALNASPKLCPLGHSCIITTHTLPPWYVVFLMFGPKGGKMH